MAGLWLAASAAAGAKAADRLPVFDTHLHYSRNAWGSVDPGRVIGALEAAGVPRALVSSSPDEGTMRLHRADPDRFLPVLRPYRAGVTPGNWFHDPGTPGYVAARLERGIYRGIGEFHLFDVAAARTPQVRQIAAMAVERGIVLHVHSAAAPVRTLFAIEPTLKILWAHAGFATAEEVGALLDDQRRLWAELSFRAADIAPGGRLDPAWHRLMSRHPDRFVIGTDTYIAPRWADYGELVAEHRRWLEQLPREVAESITYGNADRLFGAGPRR